MEENNLFIFKDMLGQIFNSVIVFNNDELIFETKGRYFKFYHIQSCCESVYIEDVVGDLRDLENSKIVMAEQVSLDEPNIIEDLGYLLTENYTWTFYKFATIKGSVTVRWIGYSNGFYSEKVDFYDSMEGETYIKHREFLI